MSQYIPSLITPGKHFSISAYKPQGRGRKPVITVTEGTRDLSSPNFHGFSYILHEARMHRVEMAGNNTAGNRAKATAQMLAELVEKGWVSPEDAAAFDVSSVS